MIDIERAIISTVLFQDLSNESDFIKALELKEDWFSDGLHKIIVKCINWLNINSIAIDENIVLHYISKNNQIDIGAWEQIISSNSFGSKNTILSYIDMLKQNSKRRVYEI